MSELIHAENGQFASPIIACKAQGTAICHRNSECEDCAFALAKLNLDKPLFFFMSGKKGWIDGKN